MRLISIIFIGSFLISGAVFARAPQLREISNTDEVLSPKQQKTRARKKAFQKKIMNMSYGDLEEEALHSKKMARVLKRLHKKGIKNAAHYEQYKARRKGEEGRQLYPRRWQKAGNGRDNIYQQRTQGIQ